MAIFPGESGGWTIPLTLRPKSLKHHGGQICLPGGRVEQDEDVEQAALREFSEELGVTAEITQRCGELSSQYVYASDNLVHPVVFVMERPKTPWRPDPVEVDEVILIPLDALTDPGSRRSIHRSRSLSRDGQQVGRLQFRAGAIEHRGRTIWGATAMILDELAQMLHHTPA